MESIGVTEARKNLSKIISKGKSIEVSNPYNRVVILPKQEWQRMQHKISTLEKELINHEMDAVMARNEPKVTSEEVEKMLKEIIGG